MFDVLEHIEDDVATLKRVADLLTPDGRVLVTVPANPRLWSSFDVASHHHRRYTKKTLAQSFRSANLELEYVTPFMSALYLPARITRRRPATSVVDGKAIIESESRINSLVNAVAYALLLPEVRWIARGKRLPFGTSILAVGRRIPT
jgi:hypothetical protein